MSRSQKELNDPLVCTSSLSLVVHFCFTKRKIFIFVFWKQTKSSGQEEGLGGKEGQRERQTELKASSHIDMKMTIVRRNRGKRERDKKRKAKQSLHRYEDEKQRERGERMEERGWMMRWR